MSPSRSAQVLAHYARHRAADTKFASPFAYAAYQAGIKYLVSTPLRTGEEGAC